MYEKGFGCDILQPNNDPAYIVAMDSELAGGLVPTQDGPFFYTRSHLSALQNCAVLFSTNFQIIFIIKKCTT